MTTVSRLLSVRLDPALAEALERHCAQTGATRSEIVKQSVAQYIVEHAGPTLGSLADAVLPAAPGRMVRAGRASRQKRFRDYVREKRRR
jgi:predicted transcriptional regulator